MRISDGNQLETRLKSRLEYQGIGRFPVHVGADLVWRIKVIGLRCGSLVLEGQFLFPCYNIFYLFCHLNTIRPPIWIISIALYARDIFTVSSNLAMWFEMSQGGKNLLSGWGSNPCPSHTGRVLYRLSYPAVIISPIVTKSVPWQRNDVIWLNWGRRTDRWLSKDSQGCY